MSQESNSMSYERHGLSQESTGQYRWRGWYRPRPCLWSELHIVHFSPNRGECFKDSNRCSYLPCNLLGRRQIMSSTMIQNSVDFYRLKAILIVKSRNKPRHHSEMPFPHFYSCSFGCPPSVHSIGQRAQQECRPTAQVSKRSFSIWHIAVALQYLL